MKNTMPAKIILSAALLLFVFSAAALAQNFFSGTLEEALTKAKAESKLVLIDFYSGG